MLVHFNFGVHDIPSLDRNEKNCNIYSYISPKLDIVASTESSH